MTNKEEMGITTHKPSKGEGYLEKVSDEALFTMVEQGITNSVGDWLNSSTMASERMKATAEYGMMATGHLSPTGVSSLVSSDTVEVVDGFAAIIGKMMFGNNKIARFIPVKPTPTSTHQSKVAADLVNFVIFRQNPGWSILNTWVKSSLLWKNSYVKWEYTKDQEYEFEEFDEIGQAMLDDLLSDPEISIAGSLGPEEMNKDGTEVIYKDVRLRRTIDKSKVKLSNIPPESFRITRDSTLDDAPFVGIQSILTRSDIRKMYPESEIDFDEIGEDIGGRFNHYSREESTRKKLTGEEYKQGHNQETLEANREVTLTECWMRVDRDGDGIAELKHFVIAGKEILFEADASMIPIAMINPIEIPHEFHGLSIADMVRTSTLAQTAILRGFIENTYLTNYSPKLADPSVVDFGALQNLKPKQIIPTNGPPQNAVFNMPPESISQGTIPMMEMLQMHKEQATGLSKAAQGLNDTLYVSGNSQEKLAAVQSATQLRIEFIVRRLAETGFKRLIEGVYLCIRKNIKETDFIDIKGNYSHIDPMSLPARMHVFCDTDVGDHSNTNTLKKMSIIGQQVVPSLQSAGAGSVIAPSAAATIAAKTIEAMDLDPLDYMIDYTTEEFKSKAEASRKQEQEAAMAQQQSTLQKIELENAQLKANVNYTNATSLNSKQDNLRQLFDVIDNSDIAWAKMTVEIIKECMKDGITDVDAVLKQLPPRRTPQELAMLAGTLVGAEDIAQQMKTPIQEEGQE